MKKSLPLPGGVPHQSSGSDSDGIDQVHDQSIIVPTEVMAIADSFEKKEQAWFVTSQIPTDLSIQVQDVTFTVHKYPLVSKSGYIGRLELQPSISNFGYELKLENFPGGSETFEIILKFCYGLPLDLNPHNIVPLRCASEFLEMTEEVEDGNLISKTEAFLTFVVLTSWKDTITVVRSCESFSPWAENLQIVRRCCDSIAWKASKDNSTAGDIVNQEGWWFDDVATLRIDHFMRIITGIDDELEGLRGYGYGKNELQFGILRGRKEDNCVGHSREQKSIIESLVSILPSQPEAVPCKFLLKLLKMAMIYSASQALISELEKRVGVMLENANADDLLIPDQHTMYNTDVVQRIVEYFLMHEQEQQQQKMLEHVMMVFIEQLTPISSLILHSLQKDYLELQQECEKMNKQQKDIFAWTFSWKKIRKSALFHRKVEGDENGERQHRGNPSAHRMNPRRRRSMA